MTKISSWNVNGIRAAAGKGFFDWVSDDSADMICIQETKADPSQLSKEFFELTDQKGHSYFNYWASAKRKGYSGVALYTKIKPDNINTIGISEFDDEGRYLEADFGSFAVISAYFPNSQEAGARLDYKLSFCDAVLERCNALTMSGKHIILSGDYNIAHTAIDLKHPKANEGNPGYLPEERAWMTRFLANSYTDSFRSLHPEEPGHYSWWSYRMNAREKDIGWRIDYNCIDSKLVSSIRNSYIQKTVMGSDHCPVSLELKL